MAAYSVIFAGGLAYLGQTSGHGLGVATAVFAMGLPGFTIASSINWFGELRRMGKIGFYLAQHEEHLARLAEALGARGTADPASHDVRNAIALLVPRYERNIRQGRLQRKLNRGGRASTADPFAVGAPPARALEPRLAARIWMAYAGSYFIYVGATLISLLTYCVVLVSSNVGQSAAQHAELVTVGIVYCVALLFVYAVAFTRAVLRERYRWDE
jgi:hypothetical protein